MVCSVRPWFCEPVAIARELGRLIDARKATGQSLGLGDGAAMLPAVRLLGTSLWTLVGVLSAGCGSDDSPAAPVEIVPVAAQQAAANVVDQLVEQPSVPALLTVLRQPHQVAQTAGPHRLTWEAKYVTTPAEVPSLVPVGEPAPAVQEVSDKLILEWAPGNPERLYLRQGGEDPPACHEYMVADKTVYTKLPHRGWLTHPLEAGAHQLWLDEAIRGPHDVVEFAAPALEVSLATAESTVEVSLRLAGSVDGTLVAQGQQRKWRRSVVFTRIDGTIELERTTGLWRRATIDVGYSFEDVRGQRVTGSINFRGELQTGLSAEEAVRAVPTEVEPTPTRTRYELEKREILKGLIHL